MGNKALYSRWRFSKKMQEKWGARDGNKGNTEIVRAEIKQPVLISEHRFVITVQLTAEQWDYLSRNYPTNELDSLCTINLDKRYVETNCGTKN